MSDEVKVSFFTKSGFGPYDAYIDYESGRGTYKDSDEPVCVFWDEDERKWVER